MSSGLVHISSDVQVVVQKGGKLNNAAKPFNLKDNEQKATTRYVAYGASDAVDACSSRTSAVDACSSSRHSQLRDWRGEVVIVD